jgi:hypothetical protein
MLDPARLFASSASRNSSGWCTCSKWSSCRSSWIAIASHLIWLRWYRLTRRGPRSAAKCRALRRRCTWIRRTTLYDSMPQLRCFVLKTKWSIAITFTEHLHELVQRDLLSLEAQSIHKQSNLSEAEYLRFWYWCIKYSRLALWMRGWTKATYIVNGTESYRFHYMMYHYQRHDHKLVMELQVPLDLLVLVTVVGIWVQYLDHIVTEIPASYRENRIARSSEVMVVPPSGELSSEGVTRVSSR